MLVYALYVKIRNVSKKV